MKILSTTTLVMLAHTSIYKCKTVFCIVVVYIGFCWTPKNATKLYNVSEFSVRIMHAKKDVSSMGFFGSSLFLSTPEPHISVAMHVRDLAVCFLLACHL